MPGSEGIDPLLEAYRKELDRQLARRRSLDNRLDRAANLKATTRGYAGAMCEHLEIERRHWPTVHEVATAAGVPIITTRLGRDDPGHQLTIKTTSRGALRLKAEIDQRP